MKTLPLSEVKMKLSALVENIRATDEEIIITRNGYPAAVLISPEKFDGWRETIAIQNDAQLLAEIKQGLAELKTKQTNLYTLEELFEA